MTTEKSQLTLETVSVTETEALGEMLGRNLVGGEVLALEGTLGSGKTTLIRGLARGLGIRSDEISSPTFVYLHEHRGRIPLIHVDLYRTEKPSDLPDLGVLEYLDGPSVIAIEWAEKAAGFLPPGTLTLRFEEGRKRSHRKITFTSSASVHQTLFKTLRDQFCVIKN